MITRKQLEAEAEELFPTDDTTYISIHMDDLNSDLQRAFIKGRTITTEQVEAAAETLYEEFRVMDADIQPTWHELPRRRQSLSVMEVKYAFRAAGFYVEGDDVSKA